MLKLLSNFSQDSGIVNISLSDVYEDEDGIYIRLYGIEEGSIYIKSESDNNFLTVESSLSPSILKIQSEWKPDGGNDNITRRFRVKFRYSYKDSDPIDVDKNKTGTKITTVSGAEQWNPENSHFQFNVGKETILHDDREKEDLKLEYLDFYCDPIPQKPSYVPEYITLQETKTNTEIQLKIDNKFIYSDYLETGKYHYKLGEEWSKDFSIDLEDIVLSDAGHVLKISYNPKISSFKTTIQEQKIDTIGGRFPFFVRNGNLKYKEFPIGGLLSFQMDDQFLFNSDLAKEVDNITTAAQMFAVERKFKLAVQDWLMNGQPKLFRSPTEGNYIVRLMNVSLSPEDKLSRMLHSFSATAYEIAEYNDENLEKYNLKYKFPKKPASLSAPARTKTESNWVETVTPARRITTSTWEEETTPSRISTPEDAEISSGQWVTIEV